MTKPCVYQGGTHTSRCCCFTFSYLCFLQARLQKLVFICALQTCCKTKSIWCWWVLWLGLPQSRTSDFKFSAKIFVLTLIGMVAWYRRPQRAHKLFLLIEAILLCNWLTDSWVCFQLDCSAYELERLHTKVTSLCNRIEQIQCHNAKDRLAQSGKAVCTVS